MVDPLRLAYAILPIACYMVVLAMLRWRKHPTLLSKSFDLLLLGMACSGLVAVGPLELFFPRAAYSVAGNWVWLVLLALYFLSLLLVVFNAPPGVVAYGMDRRSLRSAICQHLESAQIPHQWQGDVLLIKSMSDPMSGLGGESIRIQGAVLDGGMSDNAIFSAVGQKQDLVEWVRFEQALTDVVQKRAIEQPGNGLVLVLLSAGLFLAAFGSLAQSPASVYESVAWIFEENS